MYKQAAAAAAIVIVSAVAAFLVLPIHGIDSKRLARLVPAGPPPGFKAKPSNAAVENPTQSSFAAVKAAAKQSPKKTGSYTISWDGKSTGDSAFVLVSLVPTEAQARTVLAQVRSQALGPAAYQSNSYKFSSNFTVPGVPGSVGALYLPTTASVKQQLAVAAVPFRNSVAVVIVDQAGQSSAAQSNNIRLARAEYRQLEGQVPGFGMESTRWPGIATAIWAGLTGLAALAVLTIPAMVRRVRARHELARQEAARRLVLARGSKIARRQSAHKR